MTCTRPEGDTRKDGSKNAFILLDREHGYSCLEAVQSRPDVWTEEMTHGVSPLQNKLTAECCITFGPIVAASSAAIPLMH